MRTRELRPGWFFRRGDIYLANLNPFTGSEQGGTRPVLVLQNNDGNFYCPTLIVAPMTTQIKKLNQPTHYLIKNNRALAAPSMVEFEQIKAIDKSRIKLNYSHIEYVLSCLRRNTSKVNNIKKYLLAALFNAPSTIDGYYQAEVQHDMPELAFRR